MAADAVSGMTDDDIRRARRLCFFAHYHPRAIVADYVLMYLHALDQAGFTVVVLSTAALAEAERAKMRGACAMLIERENVGLDFGGWIEAFQRFSPIEAELLLLANDSVYGPVHDLSAFIDRLTAIPADFYGAVESCEGARHLQSWFLLLRPTAYRSAAFADLMARPIPADLPKIDIIGRYEMALMAALTAQGLRHHAAFSPRQGGSLGRQIPYNPSHLLWKQLVIRFGIPFIKVELLRDNPWMIGDTVGWRRVVRRYAPDLESAIEVDLAVRQTRRPPGLRERLAWSVGVDRPAYWPELHRFLISDAVHGSRWGDGAHVWLYRLVLDWSRRTRRWILSRKAEP